MKKRNVIIYFHGFNSSPNTLKVERLRRRFPNDEVYAFDIPIDPDISIDKLMSDIDSVLLDKLHIGINLVFVGTSLGAWYAEYMSRLYDASRYLINPSYNPSVSLLKYGVGLVIASKYDDMYLFMNAHYYIGTKDEVIDYSPILNKLPHSTKYLEADHAFNGDEFDVVMEDIDKEIHRYDGSERL